MASRILQFPARNAFNAPHSHDSLARDTQEQACRIAEQVEREIARQAHRLTSGRGSEFTAARNRRITMIRQPSPTTRLRRTLANILRSLTPEILSRR